MITKDRLEELIKESAKIYDISSGKYVGQRELDNLCWVDENMLCFDRYEDGEIAYLEDLYETEEQAEWALKYHATRTEELDLPMWEEPKADQIIDFICKNKETARLYVSKFYNCISVEIGDWTKFRKEFTEENYKEACDLCLKLFKGEEE